MERLASGARGESRGVLDGIVYKDLFGVCNVYVCDSYWRNVSPRFDIIRNPSGRSRDRLPAPESKRNVAFLRRPFVSGVRLNGTSPCAR